LRDGFTLGTPYYLTGFKLLLSVNGVGPKAALTILSTYDYSSLMRIIYSKDSKALTLVSGIGKTNFLLRTIFLDGLLEFLFGHVYNLVSAPDGGRTDDL